MIKPMSQEAPRSQTRRSLKAKKPKSKKKKKKRKARGLDIMQNSEIFQSQEAKKPKAKKEEKPKRPRGELTQFRTDRKPATLAVKADEAEKLAKSLKPKNAKTSKEQDKKTAEKPS